MKANSLRMAVLALGVMAGCGTRKQAPTAPVQVPVSTTDQTVKSTNPADFNAAFNTVTLKGRADINLPGVDNNVGVQMRIANGKQIWISVTAIAGIEVARALITPDSVRVLNKLKGQYIARPFSLVQEYAGKQVSYNALQDLLLGNVLTGIYSTEAKRVNTPEGISFEGNAANLVYSFLVGSNNRVATTRLKDTRTNQAIQATYGNYTAVYGVLYPQLVALSSVSGLKNANVQFTYNSIEVNSSPAFPFTVPAGYTRK